MLAMLIPWGLFYSCCFICSALSQIAPGGIRCPPDEIPVQCIDRCQTCEYRNGRCSQGAVCTPGCNCFNGYFRNRQGKCVPAAFCDALPLTTPGPIICPLNEIPVPCIDRCQRCEYRKGGCVQIQVCTPGCNCLQGFYRNKQGQCIPENFCDALPLTTPGTNICPLNEIPVPCIDRCQTCEYRKGGCVQILVCTPGCNCLQGFYRNKQGQCIPEQFCDATTVATGECDLTTVGNGYYQCVNGPDGCRRCDITCDGKPQGKFVCCPGKGWKPLLPKCVKPKRK